VVYRSLFPLDPADKAVFFRLLFTDHPKRQNPPFGRSAGPFLTPGSVQRFFLGTSYARAVFRRCSVSLEPAVPGHLLLIPFTPLGAQSSVVRTFFLHLPLTRYTFGRPPVTGSDQPRATVLPPRHKRPSRDRFPFDQKRLPPWPILTGLQLFPTSAVFPPYPDQQASSFFLLGERFS